MGLLPRREEEHVVRALVIALLVIVGDELAQCSWKPLLSE
jgi:hypothetical protein